MRWNFLVFGADIAFFSLGLSISSAYTVLPLFVHHLTADNTLVALIPAVRMLGQLVPQLFVASTVERRSRALPLILRWTILERVPFLLLGLGALLLVHVSPGLLLVLLFSMVLLANTGSGLCFPPWLDMISRSVPMSWIGRFFGFWTGVGGVLGIGGAAIAAALLANVAFPLNFALCFLLTFAAYIVSYVLLTLGREPARTNVRERAEETEAPIQQLRAQAGEIRHLLRTDNGLQRLIASNALQGIATMAGALFAVAAIKRGGLTDAQVGVESTVLFVATTAGNFLWGALGDARGHKSVLLWGSACAGLAAFVALGAHGFAAYAAVFLLLGLNVAAINLAGLTFIAEYGPERKRPTYIALSAVSYAPFAVGAPILGGWIADTFGYPPVFVIAMIAGFAAALGFWLWVPDPRKRAAAEAPAA